MPYSPYNTSLAPTSTPVPAPAPKISWTYGAQNLNQNDINYNAVVVGSVVGVLCGVASLLVLFSGVSMFKTMM